MNWSQPAYVYGLRFEGEEIFYIGSARNKTARMRSHSSYKENASEKARCYVKEAENG